MNKINLSRIFRFFLMTAMMLVVTSACADKSDKSAEKLRPESITKAVSGMYKLVKGEDPSDYKYQYSDVPGGVCEAYEKNLAQFSNEPYGMACGRKLDPAFGFTRPKWEKLDVLNYPDLMRDVYRAEHWDTFRDFDSQPWLARLESAVERGLKLEIARVDLNGDGKLENLLRVGNDRACEPKKEYEQGSTAHKTILIGDYALSKIEATTLILDNVIIYGEKVYADTFRGFSFSEKVRQKQGHDAELLLYQFARYGAGRICKFYYDAVTDRQLDLREGR